MFKWRGSERGAEGRGRRGPRGEVRLPVGLSGSSTQQHSPSQPSICFFGLAAPSHRDLRAPPGSGSQIHDSPVYPAPHSLPPSSQPLFTSSHPLCVCPQPVCSAVRRLRPGRVARRAGDARSGRCVPPALLHLQRLFLPPADRRPLRPQGRAATVCQGGLPPVSGQPDLLRHW